MALPIAAAAIEQTVLAIGTRNPGVLAVLAARLRAAGHAVGNKAEEIIAWAKNSPGNATIVAATAASLGIQFTGAEGQEAEILQKLNVGNLSISDAMRLIGAGAASETLNLDLVGKASDLMVASEVLRFAKAHYGSIAEAKRAHDMHQAFFEMSRGDVEVGFQVLR